MPAFSTARVASIIEERSGLQRVTLDTGRRAYVLTQLIGPVAPGDRVVVNTIAVDRGLGTGGWDVVHWNLARDRWTAPGAGHIMKLRYTSLQVDTGSAEEVLGYDEDVGAVAGVPVVALFLHSQLAPVAAAFKQAVPGARLAYVMTDTAALPFALSDLVSDLVTAGLIDGTVTSGQAFGGEIEAVSLPSALALAVSQVGADAIVVGSGPGVAGTESRLGFSAIDVVNILVTAITLGAAPIVAVRYSDADTRPRHRGVSHHVHSVLDALSAIGATGPIRVAIPSGASIDARACPVAEVQVPDVRALFEAAGITVTTMGRPPDDDPGFFRWAAAAGVAAADVLTRERGN